MLPEQYLNEIVCPIVTFPSDVAVEKILDERGILLRLSVHKEDMGKIIGKQGETARALRSLMRQYGFQNNSHIALKINEPLS